MTQELWIPGPTHVRPELLDVLAEPMIGHRTPEMRAFLHGLDPYLMRMFGVEGAGSHAVAVHSCTATGLMEAGLRAVGRRVLSLVHGAFSRRFAEIAEALGKEVVRVESAAGAPADLAGARDVLDRSGPFDAITVCLSETSTGALTPPADVADALGDRGEASLLVDAVTYLGAAPVDAARHGLDLVLAGTQKALALPPGLGLLCASESILERARSSTERGYFLDLVRIVETHAAAKPPMTPTISLVRALLRQLETIDGGALEAELTDEPASALAGLGGWERRYRRHARMRALTLEGAGRLGLGVVGPPGRASAALTSPSVTCLDAGGRDVGALLARLADRGFRVAPGYGSMRDTALRIGHMGDHSIGALVRLLDALGDVLDP
ncbi:MAG: aminotransferase class V-fold PLP-dependent enzyme [Planctomycetota bacterium]